MILQRTRTTYQFQTGRKKNLLVDEQTWSRIRHRELAGQKYCDECEPAMAAELIMAPEAEEDVSEAYDFYERNRVGLGEDFLSRLDACIQFTRRVPKAHSLFHLDYRRALVRKFPYAVFYTYDEANDRVTVYCVFHTSRDPKKLIERLS